MNKLTKKLYQIIRWFRKDPENFVRSVPMNLLGFQIVRVLWAKIKLSVRLYRVPKEVWTEANILKKDGVIVIHDFLDNKVFDKLNNEWVKVREKIILKPRITEGIEYAVKDGRARIHAKTIYQSNDYIFNLLEKHIHNNDFIKKLGSSVVRHKIESFSPFQLIVHQKIDDEAPDLDSDIYFHPDVSFHGIKIFLYLNNVNRNNGAFIYAKGSHEITFNRLKFEYLKSIGYAIGFSRHKKGVKADPKTGRGWHCLTREEEKKFSVVGSPIKGKANTLIMFNVMGFHRRGDFINNEKRELVATGYRR